jgi:hypothetical protein
MILAKLINAFDRRKNSFNWMAFGMAHSKSPVWQSEMFSPLRKSHGFALVRQPYVISLIDALNFAARPFAIFLAVMAVIVSTLKRHAFGRQSHICVEVLKLVPALADSNPASAVSFKAFDVGIAASIEHGIPHKMDWSFAHAVSSVSVSRRISATETAARLRVSISKTCSNHLGFVSAIAVAQPSSRTRANAPRNSADSHQLSKPLSSKVDFVHAWQYLRNIASNQAGAMT